ncbi:MAG: arylesterase [Geminicoccaceae bacterium]
MVHQMVNSGGLLKACALAISAFLVAGSTLSTAAPACRISALGDSLTAAYGIEVEQGFPAQLQRALETGGYDCEVLDAGVSGDTTAGGLARLDWMLADQPSHVILELGANDGLRGLPTEQMEANLDAIITRLKEAELPVLLTGMLPPPNLGKDYTEAFAKVFEDLAERHDIPLYPFFLDGVAGERELNQPDQLHPLPEGVAVIVERIMPTVTAWLDASGGT